ncbi:hypothetical protein PGT21_036249 [Puccinia graminis f. sp. tritici]|uniref:Uncharacterized protein n=1 Tax=Puccinia graminis f. sp. tritici TaxID=56615 RepID=A0A5B0PMF7_PUCGR|nr:hypothetical protein PGT21_036249 [Puccinia graminis f. sp. tritici]
MGLSLAKLWVLTIIKPKTAQNPVDLRLSAFKVQCSQAYRRAEGQSEEFSDDHHQLYAYLKSRNNIVREMSQMQAPARGRALFWCLRLNVETESCIIEFKVFVHILIYSFRPRFRRHDILWHPRKSSGPTGTNWKIDSLGFTPATLRTVDQGTNARA